VDLDGAISGKPKNLHLVRQIIKAVDIPIQFGGGIRNMQNLTTLLDYGAKRVVLGTKAAEDRVFLKKAFKKFKDKIIVSIDAKANRVLTKGWRSSYRNTDVIRLGHYLKDTGFKQVIYTDVLRDGTLKGPNIKAIKNLIKETGLSVIASGGISSLDDICRLKTLQKKGVVGVIIGKALYEGKFTLSEALKLS
jgi:phosphoribosylformimino-5-aminoimidazole carboxamide ribotide isomerase